MRRAVVAVCVVAFGVFLVADGLHRPEKRWLLVAAGFLAIGMGLKNSVRQIAARPT